MGPGATYVPPLDVVIGWLRPPPLAGPAAADARGSASWTLPVPAGAAGRSVWLQAVQFRNDSNVIAVQVL